ncbi:hypothetical protein ACG92Y_04450 [Acinetobacter ursingii]
MGRSFGIIGICANALPMLDWDYSHTSICFNPKKIPKVPNRKQRKACYQAFALYKKSLKPKPKPKLKISKDEWPAIISNAIRAYSDHITDSFSFFAHCYKERAKVAAQYECRWDLGKEL